MRTRAINPSIICSINAPACTVITVGGRGFTLDSSCHTVTISARPTGVTDAFASAGVTTHGSVYITVAGVVTIQAICKLRTLCMERKQ